MRNRRLSFAALSGLAAVIAAWPGAASACLPPPPGWVPPTEEEQVRSAALGSTDIVFGEVTRGSGGGRARFRILHVYKGSLRPGTTIRGTWAGASMRRWRGMIRRRRLALKARRDFLSPCAVAPFLSDGELELMLARVYPAAPARAPLSPRPVLASLTLSVHRLAELAFCGPRAGP